MNVCDYASIIRELWCIGGLNVNDRFFNSLFQKYNDRLSEETLRSIIGLWYQRKVAQTSYKVKEIDIHELYKSLLANGENYACMKIAENLDYPPSLIAKIVVTNYTVEKRIKKTKTNNNEPRNLRKQPCSYCKLVVKNDSRNRSHIETDTNIDNNTIVNRYEDPRIELALNLFDEDDEIGKYFLNKFTFSQNKTKKNEIFDEKIERNKPNKFFWRASTFEEMGEKNIKKITNVAELFSNPSVNRNVVDLQNRLQGCKVDILKTSIENQITKDHDIMSLNAEVRNKSTERDQIFESNYENDIKKPEFVAKEKQIPVGRSSTSNNDGDSCEDPTFGNVTKSNELKSCNCDSDSNSENSDTDSASSDDDHDNFSVKELLENPSLIEDPVLAQDVFLCTLYDDQYGPTSDIIANSSGITYERILEEHVKNVGLSYKTENKLRGVGVDKTPDIILLVPVAVNDFVINWIESKALFADHKLHQDFENNQFKNYINRFGPGLVIYWHGYTTDIKESELVNKQLIIEDRFPPQESFTFVNSDKFKLWMQSYITRP